MRARSGRWAIAAAALLVTAVPARAADVTFIASTSTTAASSRTMRIPRTGTLSVPPLASGLLVVAVGINNIDYQVESAVWDVTTSSGTRSQALHITSSRSVTTPETCRTELWVLSTPLAGSGAVTVTVKGTTSPTPSMGGSLLTFANVGSISANGPCCVQSDSSNVGSGTVTINKTFLDTSRGDALVNAVCTSWSNGAVSGMPGPDPANDPEMVPRTFQTTSNMQHFTGTSPGGDADPPATSYRHLRWLQTGTRSWAIAGLSLHATPTAILLPDAAAPPPDTAPPPDAGILPRDAAPVPADAALVGADATAPLDTATSSPEVPSTADSGPIAPPDVKSGPPVLPSPAVDAAPFEPGPDADPKQRQVSLEVGCACRFGARGGGGGLALALVALLLVRRRDDSRRLP